MLELVHRTGAEFGISVIVSSHLLGEIERVCTHLVAIEGGRLQHSASIGDFTTETATLLVELEDGVDAMSAMLSAQGFEVQRDERRLTIALHDDLAFDAVRDAVAELGLALVRLERSRNRLETLFEEPAPAAGPANHQMPLRGDRVRTGS